MLQYRVYERLKEYDFILASTSPRRYEILKELGIENIEIIPSDFEENVSKEGKTPQEYVAQTAFGKIDAVRERIAQDQEIENKRTKPILLLGADTIVVNSGKIFEKPKDKSSQLQNLYSFRLNPIVEVITAIYIYKINEQGITEAQVHKVVTSYLRFDKKLSDDFLQAYVDSEEGLNAAGGFKIQGIGGLLWTDCQGDYRNVIGLPFKDTFNLLENILL